MSQTYSMGNSIIGYVCGKRSYTPPDSWYLGLSTTTITQDGTGVSEPTGGGYSRIKIANDTVNFTTPSDGKTTNAVEFQFPISTEDWGTVTDFALFETSSSAEPKIYGKLTSSKIVQTGTILIIIAGAMEMTQSNVW